MPPFLLLLFTLLLALSSATGESPFEKCDGDACLRYVDSCLNATGGLWTTMTFDNSMDDGSCIRENKTILDLMLTIDIISPQQWQIGAYSPHIHSFSIQSSKVTLRLAPGGEQWILEWRGGGNQSLSFSTKKSPFSGVNMSGENPLLHPWHTIGLDLNGTEPLLGLFSNARLSLSLPSDRVVSYDQPGFWHNVAERGLLPCAKKTLRPALLIILVTYATISTLIALILGVLIFNVGRRAKYQSLPSSSSSLNESTTSIPKRARQTLARLRGQQQKKSTKMMTELPRIPEEPPAAAPSAPAADADATVSKAATVTQKTDISRLQTEEAQSRMTRKYPVVQQQQRGIEV